ncbi:MAG: antibiotic biosynthesis monooxygenase [Alphaproteobacteria bacterium]|nr:antibiotic biosynthesis monooxygenase [Alphaproteobacteria bacterium]
MIVVTGTIELAPEDSETLIEPVIEVMRLTSAEKGCIVYRFYRDLENAALFRVYEEWESQADLDAHLKSAHIAEFGKALQSVRVVGRSLKVLEIESARPL